MFPLAGNGGAARAYIEDVFSAYTYTGNGSTQTITNGIDLASKGGLVWTKDRAGVNYHVLFDTARGGSQQLKTNATDGQGDVSLYNYISAFNADGFTAKYQQAGNPFNYSGINYVSWTFRKAPKFFDVVKHTAGSSLILNHSLGQLPGMVIIKGTATTSNWYTVHRGSNGWFNLNTTDAALTATKPGIGADTTAAYLGATATTIDCSFFQASSDEFIVYLFAHDASTDGLIQCGSFTTDASGNATVTLGWEPQLVIGKRSDSAGGWNMQDVMRGMSQSDAKYVMAQSGAAESDAVNGVKPTATGFTVSGTLYAASATIVYLAIRRGPMRKPTSGTQVYQAIARTGTGTAATVTGVGFPPDLVMPNLRALASNGQRNVFDRLRGSGNYLGTATTNAESADSAFAGFDVMDGFRLGSDSNGYINSGTSYINWCFRRYPSVIDTIAYTGSLSSQTLAHNLCVAPELVIIKNRTTAADWYVFAPGLVSQAGALNLPDAFGSSISGNTCAATSITLAGNAVRYNSNGDKHIAYLFATLAGISKVGSYTGNGTSQTIDCGFAAGARFVMIKRVSAAGGWLVYDTVRGIVDATEPYLQLNSAAAEDGTFDHIDPHPSGFALPAASGLNTVGDYIYLAIA